MTPHSPPYCTAQDLLDLRLCTEAELIQLTDTQGLGVIDAPTVAAAAETAAIEIDPYLAAKTPVPLTVVPAPVVRLAGVLTRFYLYSQAPTEHVQRQYDAAIRSLEQIAKGQLLVGAEVPAPSPEAVQWESVPTVWGRGSDGGLA